MTHFFKSDLPIQIVPLTTAKWMLIWIELKHGPGSSLGKLQGVELPEVILRAIKDGKITNGQSVPTTLKIGPARVEMTDRTSLLFFGGNISIIEENHSVQLMIPTNE